MSYTHAGNTNNTQSEAHVTPPGFTITTQNGGLTNFAFTTANTNGIRMLFGTQTHRDNMLNWLNGGSGRKLEFETSNGDVVTVDLDTVTPTTTSTSWVNLPGSSGYDLNGTSGGYVASGAMAALRNTGFTTGNVRFFE